MSVRTSEPYARHQSGRREMLTAKTTTGTEVTLTGVEYCGQPTVRVEFIHRKVGRVEFTSSNYGEAKGNKGIVGRWDSQNVCVTVPREAFDAAMAEARAIGELE